MVMDGTGQLLYMYHPTKNNLFYAVALVIKKKKKMRMKQYKFYSTYDNLVSHTIVNSQLKPWQKENP